MNNKALRIFLFIGVILVTLAGGVAAISSLEFAVSRSILKNEKSDLQRTAQDASNQLMLLMDQYSQGALYLSDSPLVSEFMSGESAAQEQLIALLDAVRANREELSIFITDTEGEILLSTETELEGERLQNTQYLSELNSQRLAIHVGVGHGKHEVGVYLFSPIRDDRGVLVGAVTIEINPLYLRNLQKNTDEKYQALYITDMTGLILFSTDETATLSRIFPDSSSSTSGELPYDTSSLPILVESSDVFAEIYKSNDSSGIIELDNEILKEESVFAYEKVDEKPFVTLVGSNTELLMQEYDGLYPYIIVVLILCGIGASGGLLVFVDRLLRPFERLEKTAEALLSGDVETIETAGSSPLTTTIRGVLQMAVNKKSDADKVVKRIEVQLEEKEKELADQQDAILNVLEDIADEKERVEELATDLEKFKLAVDGVADVVVITDNHGKIIYANPIAEKVTGYTRFESLGKTPGSLWGGRMTHKYYQQMWKTIAHDKKSFFGEVQNVRKDRSEYIAQLHISPILDEKGEVQFYVGVQRDVTRERQIDRMKTEFISLASHQLRTPLSAIKWYLEMILDGDVGELSKEQQKYMQEVYSSNQRMIDLVNALLNISRIESGRIIVEPVSTDIHILIRDVIEEVSVLAKKKEQKIEVKISAAVPHVKLDPKLIRNVYLNLLTNALKYSPDKTTITVAVSVKGKDVYSEVKDQGYGIPTDQHNRIFTKFFRATNITSSDTEGSGLGLYLVKSIIDSSGGEIGFKSKTITSESNDSGTMFWFTLPLKGMKKKIGEVRVDA